MYTGKFSASEFRVLKNQLCALGGQQELLRVLWKTLFGCQWRIIWLHLSWKSNPLFLGTLNSWNKLLSHLVFCMGSCDLYLWHWLLYLSQLQSYLCCTYFKLKLYRPIKILGVMKREMRRVGGKITRFLPSISFCFFNIYFFFAENFVDVGKDFSQNEMNWRESLGLMLNEFSMQWQRWKLSDKKQLLVWVCDRVFQK